MIRKFLLMVAIAMLPVTAYAQKPAGKSAKFYSQTGRPQGKAVHKGNTTKFYSQSGRPEGRAVQHGSTTTYYNQSGRPMGRVVTPR